MKQLRIIFTVISAVFIAAVIPVGALVGWGWAGASGLLALLFYGLMLLCKQKQEEAEEKQPPLSPLTEEREEQENNSKEK